VHGKLGQACELDPGHASNQIGQQKKLIAIANAVSVKFCGIVRDFSKLLLLHE
jgi:hypothetical protein